VLNIADAPIATEEAPLVPAEPLALVTELREELDDPGTSVSTIAGPAIVDASDAFWELVNKT